MLEELLKLMETGKTLSLPEIARSLQTSEALAGMMLKELERIGRLEPLGGCSPGACAGCSHGAACGSILPVKAWRSS